MDDHGCDNELSALYKNCASSTLMAACYKIAATSGAVTETYTAAGASSDWVVGIAAFIPATSTTAGGGFAPRILDFQKPIIAIDGLIDGRARIVQL
jgi:hypothetical protein